MTTKEHGEIDQPPDKATEQFIKLSDLLYGRNDGNDISEKMGGTDVDASRKVGLSAYELTNQSFFGNDPESLQQTVYIRSADRGKPSYILAKGSFIKGLIASEQPTMFGEFISMGLLAEPEEWQLKREVIVIAVEQIEGKRKYGYVEEIDEETWVSLLSEIDQATSG